MSGSAGGGHFAGLILAVVSLIGLVVWLSRPSSAARLGGRRWLFAAATLPVLVGLAIFGNGSYVNSLRTALSSPGGLPAAVTQQHVDAALKIALSDEFIEYYASLKGKPAVRSAEIADKFKATVVGPTQLAQLGIQASPPPAPDQRFVYLAFNDESNALAAALSIGRADRDARWQFAQTLAMDHLVELIALEALRTAGSDADRLAILHKLASTVPQTAEWIARDLNRLKARSLSPEVAAAVDKKLSHVQRYIDDPTMRALPASTKVIVR